MANKQDKKDFIQIFHLHKDSSKPGRVVYSAKIGDVYMSRIVVEPGVVVGNHYRKNTRVMYYLSSGSLLIIFEDINNKERQEFMFSPGKDVIHLPENVAMAAKNVGKYPVELVAFSNFPLRSEDAVEYKVM